MIDLYFKPMKDNAKKPIQAHQSDAGWDLYATEEVIVYPSSRALLSTGIAVQGKFKDPKDAEKWKLEFKIEGTSGNASRLGLFPIGGVVDQEYVGEIGVILVNSDDDPVKITAGGKIAQLVPHCIPKINSVTYLNLEDSFEPTERGTDGYGSTGTANS